jgi:ABC-type multidrug transport system ATPase subunit
VDPATERLIHAGKRSAMHGRKVFVISHRISTVKRADLVIVLENGRVTQTGTHADLVSRDGHYREIVAMQLQQDDSPSEAGGEKPSHMDRMSAECPDVHRGKLPSGVRSAE